MKSLGVFCGSHAGRGDRYSIAAASFAREVARRGITVVYGGGRVGLMGVVADAALAAGGQVIGVLPRFLEAREVGHSGLTEIHLVDSMHERKAKMAELADAFVALPGGVGTLEELFEAWTWVLLGVHQKPCGLLSVGNYFDPLIAFLDRSVEEGFVSPANRAQLRIASDPAVLLAKLSSAGAAANSSGGGAPRASDRRIQGQVAKASLSVTAGAGVPR
ncbi:MAG: TIGR00730 family Rossman fold protein [Thermoanaerobaculia bacterium]